MASDNELWIHQESAVISAESHDVWRLTPDFLVASEIVPEVWLCRQATQSPDEVTIQFGPSRWVMTPNELWITSYPDRPMEDDGGGPDGDLIPALTSNFLNAVPYLPSRRLWLLWRISAVNPDRDRWMLENFLSKSWPIELGTVALQPRLIVYLDDLTIRITIRNETLLRRGEAQEESTTFDCLVSRGLDQTPGEMIQDVNHRTERLLLVERTIQQLLGNGS